MNRIIYSSPEKIRALAYQIGDYSAAQRIDIASWEVQDLVQDDQRAAAINPAMLIAVVGKEDVIFGLLRMWELYAFGDQLQTSVFRDREQAGRWIRQKLGQARLGRDQHASSQT